MTADHGSGRRRIRRWRDPWPLPEIRRVLAFRTRLDFPLALGGGRFAEPGTEALAVDVELSEPLPVRAEVPVLYVGDLELTQSFPIEENVIRFLSPTEQAGELLREGMAVELNWSKAPRATGAPRAKLELR